MEARLPHGAGPTITQRVNSWVTPAANTRDYAPINLGQLKHLAVPFYDKLIEIGYTSQYPWIGATHPAQDYAIANIGQVKNLFNIDLISFYAPRVEPAPTGAVLREIWWGVGGNYLSVLLDDNRYPDAPDKSDYTDTLRLSGINKDNYGARLSCYLSVPETGNYTFYIAGDNQSELWLATTSSSASIARIAHLGATLWTGAGQWDKDPAQQSPLMLLTARKLYYVEVRFKEGGGGDFVQVAWQTPSNANIELVPARHLVRIGHGDDIDEDGFYDAWEIATFGHLSQAPGDDFDGDGIVDDIDASPTDTSIANPLTVHIDFPMHGSTL